MSSKSLEKDFQELIFPPKGGDNSQEAFLFTVDHFILFEVAEICGRTLYLPKLQETKSELEPLDASPVMNSHSLRLKIVTWAILRAFIWTCNIQQISSCQRFELGKVSENLEEQENT